MHVQMSALVSVAWESAFLSGRAYARSISDAQFSVVCNSAIKRVIPPRIRAWHRAMDSSRRWPPSLK
jgi:hypothetical protein